MADMLLKKDADYYGIVEIDLQTFDNTTWTTRAMARDILPPAGETWPDFIPVEPLVFNTTPHATELRSIEIRLTAAQTAALLPTYYDPEERWPRFDVELTPPAGDVLMTVSLVVEIVEAQTHDG